MADYPNKFFKSKEEEFKAKAKSEESFKLDGKPGRNFKNVRISFGGKDDKTVPVKIVTKATGTVDTAATKQLAKNNSALNGALLAREMGFTKGVSWLVSQIAGDSKALGKPKRAYELAKNMAPETIREEKSRKAAQQKQKGGTVVKKTSTVKRSPNGKSKQPIKKATRTTQKATRRSKG
jgi:hypothetical protein|tara:strand:+ start:364 stop:900 length:537 start_codon:yes stop_codon:yes gene_type:complete